MTFHLSRNVILEERAWQVREAIFEHVAEAIEQFIRVQLDAEKGHDASLLMNLNNAILALITTSENGIVLKKLARKNGGAE